MNNVSIKELRLICQDSGPSKKTQSFFGLTVRLFSIYFTKIFLIFELTPNQITFLGSAIYLIGIVFISSGDLLFGVLGFVLLVASTIMDASDGEVFRFNKYKKGYGGSYVEPLSHDILYAFTFLSIGYGAYLQTGSIYAILFGSIASLFKVMFRIMEIRFFYGVIKKLPEQRHVDSTKSFKAQGFVYSVIYRIYRNLFVSTGFLLPLILCISFSRLDIFVYFYGTCFLFLWFGLFVRQIKRFSKISNQALEQHKYIVKAKQVFRKKKIIIFDLDGTLLDSMNIFSDIASYLISWKYEVSRDDARKKYLETSGIPFFQQLEILFPGNRDNSEIAKMFEERKVAATDHLVMDSAQQEAISRIQRSGIKIAVSSNNFQENVDRFAKFSNLEFSYVLGYKDGFSKGVDHFKHIIKLESLKPEDVLFVGDSLSDMRKSMENNIDFVGRIGTFSEDDFEMVNKNIFTIYSFEELESVLL